MIGLAGYSVSSSSFLNVPHTHACCKSSKICCYFSFELNSEGNQYFKEVNNHKPTDIYLFIFKAIKSEKILKGNSAWSCYANFAQVITDEICQ